MANGKVTGKVIKPDGSTSTKWEPRIEWSSSIGDGNYSWVTVKLIYHKDSDGYTSSGTLHWTLTIDNTTYSGDKSISLSSGDIEIVSKKVSAYCDSTGRRSLSISATGTGSGWSIKSTSGLSTTAVLDPIAVYSLTISKGTGSSITVNRTSSPGPTGNLSSGAKLYYGDTLKITYGVTDSGKYKLLTHTVNSSNFSSGSTHTVKGNVTVAATAQELASTVSAKNGTIGGTSAITVTRYNSNYYHSLKYKFGNLTGWINSSGAPVSSETRFQTTSINFSIPNTFYAQIPNAASGTCTITCYTYSASSGGSVLGDATTATFTASASSTNCAPTISIATMEETNSKILALHSDDNDGFFMAHLSNIKCTISAASQYSASISSTKVAGTTVANGGYITITNPTANSYAFVATDSRSFSTTVTRSVANGDFSFYNYVYPSINVELKRLSATSNTVLLNANGNYYSGKYGPKGPTNRVKIQYRSRATADAAFGSWYTIEPSQLTLGSSTFRASNIELTNGSEEGFPYNDSFVFEVRVIDGYETTSGGSTSFHVMTTGGATTIPLTRGVPVYDWGANDFKFNVPVYFTEDGLVMTSPNGTDYKITVSNSGTLVVTEVA